MTEQNRRKREQRSDQQLVKDFDAPFTALNENDFDAIWKELGGDEKWLKSFGYFQFGFHVQDAIIERLAPSAIKAAAVDLTSLTGWLAAEVAPTEVVYLASDVAALLASAAPADEAKPIAWLVGSEPGTIYRTQTAAEAISERNGLACLPLYTRAAPAAQPDAELDDTAKEALRDLSHVENYLVESDAPTTIKNRAIDVRLCIKELRAALKSTATTSSQPDEARDARLGRYVKEFAKRGGWTDDGEGAFEFIQRHSYALGLSDMGGNPSTAARADRWPVSAFAPTAASPRSGSQETPSHPDPELQKDGWRANVASQCRATATSEIAANMLVDGGSGTLAELLLDAANAIHPASHPVQQQEQGDERAAILDLVHLWDTDPMPADDYNEAMCAIETRMRALAQKGK